MKVNKLNTVAIILSAGKSKRFKSDKQFFNFKGKPLLKFTVKNFLKVKEIENIIIAISNKNFNKTKKLFKNPKIKIVLGGENRMASLRNAFSICPKTSLIAVHDGARPFVSPSLIKKTLKQTFIKGSALPVLPLKDTLKEINNNGEIKKTLDRNKYVLAQTPQCYKFDIFKKIITSKYAKKDLSDESQILEKLKIRPSFVIGEMKNLKITTREDICLIRGIYEC